MNEPIPTTNTPPRLHGLDVLPPLEPSEAAAGPRRERKGSAPSQGRFECLNNFVDFTLGSLTRAEIAVWMVLYRDARNGIATASIRDLADRAGCNKSSASRAVQMLVEKGLLKVVKQGGWKSGSSRYQVQSCISGN
jgi:predicted transcriptional regulator